MLGGVDIYISLLVNNEDWLIERILDYAKKRDYTKYTSTLFEAWRLSVSGLTESLILAAKTYGIEPPELNPDEQFDKDPVSAFGIIEARKHRERGTTLNMFLGLMKYYRQSYIDLISEKKMNPLEHEKFHLFTHRCFDRIEMGYIQEWTSSSNNDQYEQLEHSNRDITNEKNKYLTVFESFFAPIILLDENNTIVNFNLAASKFFTNIKIAGALYYNNEVAGLALEDVNRQLLQFVSSTSEELCFETYLDTNFGKRFFQVILKKMLDVSEKFKGTIVMLDDLTHRKEIESNLKIAKAKAEEADKLKTAFLANMSHEIRTPMNAILGFTELMITTSPEKKERLEFLKLIRKSSVDLLNIIEDVIDIAKIESKQLKIKYRACKPFELLNDLHAVLGETLRRYGISDAVQLNIKVEDIYKKIEFYTDPERLKQVLSNLLNNAAKFTNIGLIEFGYKVIDKSNIYFYVKDTGVGIPENMKEKIFERFTQIDGSGTRNQRGAGLGLAICKNIINLLGGEIWVESAEGIGSTFFFQLPNREVSSDLSKVSSKLESNELNYIVDWKDKVILIAEDDSINCMYLNEILKKTGAKIIWAKNGLEAINKAESEELLDLILMDVKMPEINGFEASKYISAIRPEIPIIAQTAYAMEGDKAKCLSAGCWDYVTKPIDQNELLGKIEKHLSVKKVKDKSNIHLKISH